MSCCKHTNNVCAGNNADNNKLSTSFVSSAKDNPSKGGLQGTVGSLSIGGVCSAKDNPSKGGLQGTVGSLSFRGRLPKKSLGEVPRCKAMY